MSLLSFKRRETGNQIVVPRSVTSLMEDYSIEVMPRTTEKIEDFRTLLPEKTRVYVAHIEGTPIEDMVATAARLARDGMHVMPHFPARIIQDRATLADWIARYQGEAGVDQGLILAGGVATPHGEFHSSMQLLETGLFDGFTRLHVAGHPEGNRDIDTDGTDHIVMEALRWKHDFSERTDAKMGIVTQFAFSAPPVIKWLKALESEGFSIPVHLGIAGPAKLQTLIRFAIACGVGPSMQVLQKRALDVTKLVVPYEPTDLVKELATYKAENPKSLLKSLHFFPLGGITASAKWANARSTSAPASLAPQDP